MQAFLWITVGLCLATRWHSGKESPCQCRRCNRCRFDPWVGKIPWSRRRQPTPVFMPGKFHGQRSLAGYSLLGCRVRHDWACMRARAHTHTHTHTHTLWIWEMQTSQAPTQTTACVLYVQLLHSCLTLSNTMNCSPPGTFVHGILQASILEWVAIPSPGDLWDPGIKPASPGFQDLLHKNLHFIKIPGDL